MDDLPSPRRTVVIACSALKRSYRDILRGDEADEDLSTCSFLYRASLACTTVNARLT